MTHDRPGPRRWHELTIRAMRILAAVEARAGDPTLPICATDITWLRRRLNADDWSCDHDNYQLSWLQDAVKSAPL